MNNQKILPFLLVILLLAACGTSHREKYSIKKEAQRQCANQHIIEAQYGIPNRQSNWAKCLKEKVLPLEIKWFDADEEELTQVYDHFIQNLEEWESNLFLYSTKVEAASKLESIHRNFESERAELGFMTCRKWVEIKNSNGTKSCQIWSK